MPSIDYELLKELAVLGAARRPALRPQGPRSGGGTESMHFALPNGKPSSINDGVALDARETRALLGVRLQLVPDKWTAYARVDLQGGASALFSLVGEGQSGEKWQQNQAGDVSPATVIAGWIAALNLDAAFINAFNGGLAAAVPGDTSMLTLTFDTPQRLYWLRTGAATGDVSLGVDARTVLWRVWGLPVWHSTGAPQWQLLDRGRLRVGSGANDYRWMCTHGMQRVYVEVVAADGTYVPMVGPAVVEYSTEPEDTALEAAANAMLAIDGEELLFPAGWFDNRDVVHFGQRNLTGTTAVPLPLPGDVVPPVRLPAFHLVVRNNDTETLYLLRGDGSVGMGASGDGLGDPPVTASLYEVAPGALAEFGPFGHIDKPWTLYRAVAGTLDCDVEFLLVED